MFSTKLIWPSVSTQPTFFCLYIIKSNSMFKNVKLLVTVILSPNSTDIVTELLKGSAERNSSFPTFFSTS